MARLVATAALLLAACLQQHAQSTALQLKTREKTMAISDINRNSFVDVKIGPQAPEPPNIGVAVAFEHNANTTHLRVGGPAILHGAYQADLNLIRQCPLDLVNSILLVIIRTDKPWGEVAVLRTSSIGTPPPAPDATANDPDYRRGGQFHVDLVKFFRLPHEPSRYIVETAIGPYMSGRVAFDLQP